MCGFKFKLYAIFNESSSEVRFVAKLCTVFVRAGLPAIARRSGEAGVVARIKGLRLSAWFGG
jgi:hypothetical protein